MQATNFHKKGVLTNCFALATLGILDIDLPQPQSNFKMFKVKIIPKVSFIILAGKYGDGILLLIEVS